MDTGHFNEIATDGQLFLMKLAAIQDETSKVMPSVECFSVPCRDGRDISVTKMVRYD